MKKLFALAATALFIMTSCSSDDSEPTNPGTNPTGSLLKKTIETFEDGLILTTNFNYNGNKLVSTVDSEDWETLYTYTGNLLTKIEHYDGETLYQTNVLTYDNNNKLITHIMYLHTQNSSDRSEYTYNSNGTITVENFSGDLNGQTIPQATYTVTVLNNNITQVQTGTATRTYTYTNTLDPYSFITGNNEMNLAFVEGGVNNVASFHYEHSSGTVYNDITYTYTYNDANLPVTSVETDAVSGDVTTVQYFY